MKTQNTPEELQTIKNALAKIHIQLFDTKSSDPKYNAQRNLSGRTHYFDDDTLRFHKSRVLQSGDFHGLLFWAICSDAMDMNNTSRGYRPVVHDVFGNCLSRPKIEDCFKTRKAAVRSLESLEFDLVARYRATLESNAKRMEYDLREYREAIAQLGV